AASPILPSRADLEQELSIVASPQISRDRSLLSPGEVMDLGGIWVRYGPTRALGAHGALYKTGRPDVPFTASIIVTHTQTYSDPFPTKVQAARAPLSFMQEWTTTYLYEYITPGTWVYKDQQNGPLIDKGTTLAARK
ncbi:MAG: hypothetical protein JO250_10890, partial [Armatimonadetes bacterium]|nr:hypothetical protein [Armatimonadota bacterium]